MIVVIPYVIQMQFIRIGQEFEKSLQRRYVDKGDADYLSPQRYQDEVEQTLSYKPYFHNRSLSIIVIKK